MNKKQFKNKALVISSALIITATAIGGIAYAKYIKKITGSGSLSSAKWVFNADWKKDDFNNMDLGREEYNVEKIAEGRIAPGTSGNFDIDIDARGTETGVDYTVSFNNVVSKPENLYFIVDNTKCNSFDELSEALSGHFDADNQEKQITKKVQWKWDYETTDNGKTKEENDAQDTLDGESAMDFAFEMNVIGTQSKIE